VQSKHYPHGIERRCCHDADEADRTLARYM
jgi:hypothetical protein